MNKHKTLLPGCALVAGLAVDTGAFAQVGVTDSCQEDIDKLEDEMKRDKHDQD